MKIFHNWLCCLLLFILPNVVEAESRTLEQWIEIYIENGHNLFYSSDYLDKTSLNQPIDLNQTDLKSLEQALLLNNLKLIPVGNDSNTVYVIQTKEKKPIQSLLLHAYDLKNDKNVINFRVIDQNNNHFKSQNGNIYLSSFLDINQIVTIYSSGYYSKQIEINLDPDSIKIIHVGLEPLPLALDDIRVSTSLISFNDLSNSQQTLSRQDITDQILFNNDPLRATESLAGSSTNGISGKVHTRGGNLNESLIILDNQELRNPYHFKDFFSLFSTINESVVDSIDFYSGVFPARFGGRLSSVLDLQSNQWADLPGNDINIGLLSSSYTWRHHNALNNHHYLMALRTGGHVFDKHIISNIGFKPEYDDGYFKAAQEINQHWTSSQHLLVSRDEISIDQDDELATAGYHDQNIWLQWQYDNLLNHQLNFQAYASRRHDIRKGQLNDDNTQAQVIEDIASKFQGLKFQHQWQINDQVIIDYGFDISTEETKIDSMRAINHESDLVNSLGLGSDFVRIFEFEEHGVSMKSHANLRYQVTEQWIIDLGAHYQNQEWVKGGDLSPRVNVAYFQNNTTTWHLGIGRHQQTQHIDELLLEDMIPQYYKPASADLAVIELNHRFDNNWLLQSEIYYKKYSQTHPYYENLFNELHILPDLYYDRIRLNPNDAKAAGFEFTLKGKTRTIAWAASYAYSDVKDQFDMIETPRSWNQRNSIKLNLGFPIKTWHFRLNFDFHNGWPMTRIVQTEDGLAVSQRNKERLKDFYQLGFNLNRSWKSDAGVWLFEFQVSNALNTENPCCIDYSLQQGVLETEEKFGLPLVPNLKLGFSW